MTNERLHSLSARGLVSEKLRSVRRMKMWSSLYDSNAMAYCKAENAKISAEIQERTK